MSEPRQDYLTGATLNLGRLRRALGVAPTNLALVGSKRILGESTGSDFDVLVLLDDSKRPATLGFERDLEEEDLYESDFQSWRRGPVNLLVAENERYFIAEVTAATAAMVAHTGFYDFTLRNDRVEFHRLVRTHMAHLVDPEDPEDIL